MTLFYVASKTYFYISHTCESYLELRSQRHISLHPYKLLEDKNFVSWDQFPAQEMGRIPSRAHT